MSELSLATFERVHKAVKRILNPSFDTENLAMEVMLESWFNNHPEPSLSFIRHRCYDLLRRSRKEQEIMKIPRPKASEELSPVVRDQVNRLMQVLNNQERKLIFFRYYLDLPLKEIAHRQSMDVNKVREVLTSAVFKMRESAEKE